VDTRGIIHPVSDGQATVTVQVNGLTASLPVQVQQSKADVPVSFSREVIPVITKMGCNQGACHGAQHGRGGVKLSLRSFDSAFDYAQIVQSAEGRRVVLADPERSIFLLKPTLTMEHGGGERFPIHSRSYNLLKSWLEDGAPEPSPNDATVTRLE